MAMTCPITEEITPTLSTDHGASRESKKEAESSSRGTREITLPSTLAQECASNPFLRTDSPSLRARICEREGSDTLSQVEVFAALRGWKDNS